MRYQTLEMLNELKRKFGVKNKATGPFGKIVQKILALCFYEVGFSNIVERGVQGADIDFTKNGNEKYTVEVKTTEKSSIFLSADNIEAIRERVNDGYMPVIAVLQLCLLSNWVFMKMPVDSIPVGTTLTDSLRVYKFKILEELIGDVFDDVVSKHFNTTLIGGEKYLKKVLRQSGISSED
jgi:Holliday junction resolvase